MNVHVGSHGGAGTESGIERLVTAIGRALEGENDPDSIVDADADEASATDAIDTNPDADHIDGRRPSRPPTVEPELATNHGPMEPDLSTPPPIVVLENSVGGGFGLGANLDELASIAEALRAAGLPNDRIGFCLDTAHAWGAGYELSDPTVTDTLLQDHPPRGSDAARDAGERLPQIENLSGWALAYCAIVLLLTFTLRGSRARAATPVDPSTGSDSSPAAIGS